MKNNWEIVYGSFNRENHPLQESLCTLGNGYIATRGALETERNYRKLQDDAPGEEAIRSGKKWNYAGTYLAGGYNRRPTEMDGKTIVNEDLVNWPNWLYLTFKIKDGEWFDIDEAEILHYESRLKMKEGLLERFIRFRHDGGKETTIISSRIVSMSEPHLAALQWKFIPENWEGTITIRSGIDGNIINDNVSRYSKLNQDHLNISDHGHYASGSIWLISQTKQSRILVAQAARTEIWLENGKQLDIQQTPTGSDWFIAGDFEFKCHQGEMVTIEKIATFFTSRDKAISDPLTEAIKLTERADRFDQEVIPHMVSWKQIWSQNNIEIITSENIDQLVTRIHIFHLYQSLSHNSIDLDIGIPARGWHGEAYRGHIFWDELYILPFINLHFPQLSRSLLMYRYRRLPEARYAAKAEGFRGAMFPWQSGSNGREETQKIHLNPQSGRWLPDVSHLQYHINAAIPYNVWHYYQSSGDMDFLLSHGAEMILSSALFWSSLSVFNREKQRYEILRVMGPDEYHTHYPDAAEDQPGLNNNAYTNVMAVWVMQHALSLLDILGESCCENLQHLVGYDDKELERWEKITQKMYVPIDGNIILQFDGYNHLKELDWEKYHSQYGESMRLDRILEAEGDSCNFYKAGKQADVLMLFYLFSEDELQSIFKKLNYDLKPGMILENIEYYRKRTAHGSTLSRVIHAWVYARSHRRESWNHFRNALMSDFRDVQGGTTSEGIHLGAMAGTLDLIQRCYSGIEIRDDVLWIDPLLPEDIEELKFRIRYRGHWIQLEINHQRLIINFDKGWSNPVSIGVRGEVIRFETNDRKEFKLKKYIDETTSSI
jgi:trehalose/maltose hydrolase-like predicted phosphorylase